MNTQKVRDIIKLYKKQFKAIHKQEIYKWQAVKCFQDNWNIEANDFSNTLDESLALAKNLLASGTYFPKRMLHDCAAKEPETIRHLFRELYNEDNDLLERITSFQNEFRVLNRRLFPGKNDYQDHRAILVYLSLRFPNRYYLYKYEMFKDFIELIDYPYRPSKGNIQNILEYLTLCDLVKAEIVLDSELLELHKTRIHDKEYYDSSYNILTQDVIYAAIEYIEIFKQSTIQESALKRLVRVDKKVVPKAEQIALKGSFTNHIDNDKEKKRIGDLGELLVLQSEQEKLKALGIKKYPEHKSKSEGDGLGYDILSYNERGEEIFIEVKTTVHNYDAPFYITRNELEKSKKDSKIYYLYRLYEYDDTENKAKYYERNGNLTDICLNPILYRAIVSQ